jgi:hypothetical protein
MQAAKDTFLKTLAGRLAVVNVNRTVTVDGSSRPAVLAMENETSVPANTVLEAFLLNWEGASSATTDGSLMYMDCKVSYGSKGTDGMLGTDRGRTLTAMDSELLSISEPCQAAVCDYTQNPAVALGGNIFWTRPVMEPLSGVNGILTHTAMIRVFFFPEVG